MIDHYWCVRYLIISDPYFNISSSVYSFDYLGFFLLSCFNAINPTHNNINAALNTLIISGSVNVSIICFLL